MDFGANPVTRFYVVLAIYREEPRTLVRGISHQAGTEAEAYQVFDEVMRMLQGAAHRRKKQAQQKLFGT